MAADGFSKALSGALMARPTLATHPKLAKLVHRLRHLPCGPAIARGVLELLWDAGYAEGNPFIGDAEAVEAVAGWTGAAGELAGHLRASGFLDLDDAGNYSIHDLADHAPDYVARRMARAAERAAAGTSISEIRSKARKQTTTNGIHLSSVATNVDPPVPVPVPVPAPILPEESPRAIPVVGELAPHRAACAPYPVGAATVAFLDVFERYVNPAGKIAAASTWQAIAAERADGEAGLASEILAAFDAGLLKQHPYSGEMRYRTTFEKFLSQRRWLDRVVPPGATSARGSPEDHRHGHARAEDFRHTVTGEVKL